jgi:hypothetical protein
MFIHGRVQSFKIIMKIRQVGVWVVEAMVCFEYAFNYMEEYKWNFGINRLSKIRTGYVSDIGISQTGYEE